MPAIYAAAAVAVVVAIAAAATLAPPILPPAHADGPEPGSLAFSFGSRGSDDDRFRGIGSVAVGPNGKIYVVDTGNRAIKLFHPNGMFDNAFPRGYVDSIFAGSDRVIYAVFRHGAVSQFHSDGTLTDFAFHVRAVGPDGKYYTTSEDQVHAYYPNGTLAFEFGAQGRNPEFDWVNLVTIGPDGKIYVGRHNGYIQAYYPNGTYASQFLAGSALEFGPSGEYLLNGELFYPNGTSVASYLNPVFGPTGMVVDFYGNTISVYHGIEPTDESQPSNPPVAGSRFAFEIGSYGSGPGEFRWPDNVAFGPDGVIAVSDWGNNRVNVFHPNGTFAYAFGSSGQGPGEFNRPFGIAFGPNGLLAVTDVGNHRVQFFYLE